MNVEALYEIAKEQAKAKSALYYPKGHPKIEEVEREITRRLYYEFTNPTGRRI